MSNIITSRELNLAYTKINELDKETKLDKSLPQFIWTNTHQLEFKFDPTVGRKGAWLVSTQIEVLEEELTEDEDNNEYYL